MTRFFGQTVLLRLRSFSRGADARAPFVAALLLATSLVAPPALAEPEVVNLYTARHYQTDEKLYSDFTKATGIKINRIEGKEDEIIERIRQEGANSPADVLATVDMGRLWRAEQAGILAPLKSAVLDARLPANLRGTEGQWFGFSTRARVIAYATDRVKPAQVASYADLGRPEFKGKVCVRSGSHVYNLSLMASIVAAIGEEKAEAWARGVVANFARPPQGGDTDQIKAIAAGQCDVGLVNTYYFVRALNSTKPEDKAMVAGLAVSTPEQAGRGTHVNVSGAGLVKTAPHRAAAVKFLEYLASDAAQVYFADGNNEWPAVASVRTDNPGLKTLGAFKTDTVNLAQLGKNQAKAQAIFDKVGWK